MNTAVTARTINNGQSCICAKRFIVAESIADEFTKRFVERMPACRRRPDAEHTNIGPLATAQIRDDLEDQVKRSSRVRVLLGGKRREGPGLRADDSHRRRLRSPRSARRRLSSCGDRSRTRRQ